MDEKLSPSTERLITRLRAVPATAEASVNDGRIAVRLKPSELRSTVGGELNLLVDDFNAGLAATAFRARLARIRELAQGMTE